VDGEWGEKEWWMRNSEKELKKEKGDNCYEILKVTQYAD